MTSETKKHLTIKTRDRNAAVLDIPSSKVQELLDTNRSLLDEYAKSSGSQISGCTSLPCAQLES